MSITSTFLFDAVCRENQEEKSYPEALAALEAAIKRFEGTPDIHALGEEKRMDVYRVKNGLAKRIQALEAARRLQAAIKKDFQSMVFRLAAEFPKTGTNVRSFIASIPAYWIKTNYYGTLKFNEKRFDAIIKQGKNEFLSHEDKKRGDLLLSYLYTEGPGIDRVKMYYGQQVLDARVKHREGERTVSTEEICRLLGISEAIWKNFTSGEAPLIDTDAADPRYYHVAWEDTMGRGFRMCIFKTTLNKDGAHLFFLIEENAL